MSSRLNIFIEQFFELKIKNEGINLQRVQFNSLNSNIEYKFQNFRIKIETYFKEIYITLFNERYRKDEINLFNLLEFLNQKNEIYPTSNYFHNEKDIDICIKKQLLFLSQILIESFIQITEFFNDSKYLNNINKFYNYHRNKYSDLY